MSGSIPTDHPKTSIEVIRVDHPKRTLKIECNPWRVMRTRRSSRSPKARAPRVVRLDLSALLTKAGHPVARMTPSKGVHLGSSPSRPASSTDSSVGSSASLKTRRSPVQFRLCRPLAAIAEPTELGPVGTPGRSSAGGRGNARARAADARRTGAALRTQSFGGSIPSGGSNYGPIVITVSTVRLQRARLGSIPSGSTNHSRFV